MARKPKTTRLIKRIRTLTLGLLVSGVVNIALVGYATHLKGRDFEVVTEDWDLSEIDEVLAPLSVAAALPTYESLSFDQLVAKLSSRRPVEDGYRERDLALATLVALHDFDIGRALRGEKVEKRIVRFNGQTPGHLPAIALFPGLTSDQLDRVRTFARQEEWPLTGRGLFRQLKRESTDSLVATFVLTPEFHAVEQLFSRSTSPIDQEHLVEVVQSGTWKMLSEKRDLTPDARRKFLLSYIRHGSSAAANLLVHTDRNYVVDILDDRSLVAVIGKLQSPSAEVRSFLIELLVSPRSSAVWVASADRLYAFSGEALPHPYNHAEVLKRFVPEEMLRNRVEVNEAKKERPITSHEVQKGESLWKIAEAYQITVAALRDANTLESDLIRAGQTLVIPPDHAHPYTTARNATDA